MKHSVEEIELSNGAKGLLVDVPGATVMCYEISFRAGHYLVDEYEKWETPHVMEHLVVAANKKYRDARSFLAEFQKNGAWSNASTGYTNVSYYGEIADFEWDRVLGLQMLAIGKPLFLQKEFKAEFGNIHDERNSLHNNHFRHLSTAVDNSFGFKMPTDFEAAKLMANVSRKDVVDFYKKTHNFPNMRFIIAGNVKRRKNKIIKLLEKAALSKSGERFDRPMVTIKPQKAPVFIENETVKNIFLFFDSYVNQKLTDDQMDAMSIARIMMTDTLNSSIFGKAREKGLVYSVSSGTNRSESYSNWSFGGEVLPKNASALMQIMIDELLKVLNGKVDQEALDAAKKYAFGQYQRSVQTVGRVSGLYSRYFNDGIISDVPHTKEKIESVTAERITEAFKIIFSEKIGGVGVLGGNNRKLTDELNKQVQVLWK